jgi:hypothetical protein
MHIIYTNENNGLYLHHKHARIKLEFYQDASNTQSAQLILNSQHQVSNTKHNEM